MVPGSSDGGGGGREERASSSTWEASRVDLEGEQLLRVHVVEGTQVGQLEQQLGEDGGLVGVVLGDKAAQSTDQRLLKRLHGVHVLDARSICRLAKWHKKTQRKDKLY